MKVIYEKEPTTIKFTLTINLIIIKLSITKTYKVLEVRR